MGNKRHFSRVNQVAPKFSPIVKSLLRRSKWQHIYQTQSYPQNPQGHLGGGLPAFSIFNTSLKKQIEIIPEENRA